MNLSAVVPVLVGAVFGFVANGLLTYWADRRKLRYRWDEPAFEVFSSFAASARDGRDGAARLSEALSRAENDEVVVQSRERFDGLQAKMRSDFERVALIGTPEVILAGRLMERGADLSNLNNDLVTAGPSWDGRSDWTVDMQRRGIISDILVFT